MKFYLKSRKGAFDAVAEYNEKNHTFTVLKGSRVSEHISNSPKFRSGGSIERGRDKYVGKNSLVKSDAVFNSPSMAAIFVTGMSTNGRRAWKNEAGQSFKSVFGDTQNERNER